MPNESKMPHTDRISLLTDVSGIILAGGKSSRYGKNKAFAKVKGIPLIERVVGVFETIFKEIIISSNNPEEYEHLGHPIAKDIVKGLGPLGGIFTALNKISTPYCFVAACDMPSLNEGLIRHMLSFRGQFDIIAPKMGWKIEALHALYSMTCLPHIKNLIKSGQYQVVRIFPKVSVRYVEEEEIRRYDPELKSFMNINSPQDIDRL
jgi:molybdopterin-guanine dinucleotide biosynthesis protein A